MPLKNLVLGMKENELVLQELNNTIDIYCMVRDGPSHCVECSNPMEDISTAKGIMVSLKQCWIPWEKERREQRENRDVTNWLGKTLCIFLKRAGKTLSRDDKEFEPHKYEEVQQLAHPLCFLTSLLSSSFTPLCLSWG